MSLKNYHLEPEGTQPQKYSAKDNYPDYESLNHKCIVRKYLTLEMYEQLFDKKTIHGVTLDKIIQHSVDNPSRCIGLFAGDPECYEIFKPLFDCILNEKHLGFSLFDKTPVPDLDVNHLVCGILDERYVMSCRIRTARSLKGFCLPPSISRAERRQVERILLETLTEMSADFAGQYYPLITIPPQQEKQLIADHFLFKRPTDTLMINSTSCRDWPDARGIWYNKEKTFLIWINEEDHCRVISMQQGGDLNQVFQRFGCGLKQIEEIIKKHGHEFAWSERLGYLNTCPSNIGTGLRCSVHIQLRKLGKHEKFNALLGKLQLEKRGTGGEHTETIDDVYDISNKARLMKSEVQFVQLVFDGVNKLIEIEQRLENGESIDELIPQEETPFDDLIPKVEKPIDKHISPKENPIDVLILLKDKSIDDLNPREEMKLIEGKPIHDLNPNEENPTDHLIMQVENKESSDDLILQVEKPVDDLILVKGNHLMNDCTRRKTDGCLIPQEISKIELSINSF